MKKIAPLFLVALVMVLSGCTVSNPFVKKPIQTACTMEAKLCSDGSAVGRQGPNCEFSECPLATSTAGLANPASVNCKDKGGNLVMKTRGDGGQYGLCYFEDNRACEEWSLMRGDCPYGGMRTTGYDTEEQMYCAWLGGSTITDPNASCTFKDGSVCPNDKLFKGTCNKGEQMATNLKTYKNTQYGLEFQYPENWPEPVAAAGVLTGGYPTVKSSWRLNVGSAYKNSDGTNGYGLYFDKFSAKKYTDVLKELKSDSLISNISEKVINNNKVIIYIESGMKDYTVALIFGTTQMIHFEDEGLPEQSGKFQQILSTFKFVN